MRSKRDRLITFIIGVVAVTAFVVTTFVALVWANGLSFDVAQRNFQRTAMIAVEPRLPKATIAINGDEVASASPYQQRSLSPGRYEVRISQPGYRDYVKVFQLLAGQVGIVPEEVRLLAEKPLSETLALPAPENLSAYDVGLSVVDGELLDRGTLVTRFSRDPLLVRRFNDGYLYQAGNELRLYFPDNNSDTTVKTLNQANRAIVTVDEADWRLTIYNTNEAERLSLAVTTETEAGSN